MKMHYLPVRSSNLTGVAYNSASRTLGVTFANGSEYHYLDVPPQHHDGLLSAPSPGKYLAEHIKGGDFTARRVR
jgi:hypothetical protein